ncbi:recombinase family protein [Rhodoblastus acidophilus]|uniref:Recombinase family protein n=1 Tax=Candidatus Rhodoblastus alkanivorans TaxID=2954117 RepID=A0ABS9Z117_9HYPH|nr:recombinase family protein [Candidatus Rhodoblastus alkanivorans]MCI4678262.1 recombinase family protein [Candidatus Rhodoblastus alkanivorans]MCI4681312.1 recombinase family protein [Candidatus Rhodoblastus alkanivorans]MDI4642359.1 recombinase family protein [Rhodoblastus acidophilus]
MKTVPPKRQLCAIYTRKSTEHNLDLAFNSLDAQREACEAYIKSQAHEGWSLVRDRFDDGGLSGASLERPALQDLLNRVRARQVDVIVVYKVDRLTRALADFAKLVELFDEHDVSFVSVTQSFNTKSSMGRLTLNVLLSFAQFEREVIGERVRDKIAASKRKGLWVGGPVPLGYRSIHKKLEVVEEEAGLVRKIFADYLELGSIAKLAAHLNAEGQRPKPRQLANGRTVQADCYRVGPLAHLLKNRFYIGEVVYQGEVNPGEHEPILDRDLFEAVQQRLKDQGVEQRTRRSRSPHLLTGKLFDDRGNLMSPTHANKKGVRYRYYVSNVVLQGRKADAGCVSRVSAPEVEKLVVEALRTAIENGAQSEDRQIIDAHLAAATIRRDSIEVTIRVEDGRDQEPAAEANNIFVPFSPTQQPVKGIVQAPTEPQPMDEATRAALLTAIARSKSWIDAILRDPTIDFTTISSREGLAERHVRFLAPLAYLSPRIVKAIADSRAPANLTVSSLARALSLNWPEQEAAIGLA